MEGWASPKSVSIKLKHKYKQITFKLNYKENSITNVEDERLYRKLLGLTSLWTISNECILCNAINKFLMYKRNSLASIKQR